MQQHIGEPPRLEASHLTVSRGDRVLFSDLSFCVEPGNVLLVEGRNGSGKTTLLRTVAGLRYPDEGEVTWRGSPVTEGALAGELAWISHLPGVKDDLTVRENLQMALALGAPTGLGLEETIDRLGLTECEDRLVMLDEPYTSLDRQAVGFVESLIAEHVASGGMVIMTAHQDVRLEGVELQRIDLSA